MKKGVSACPTIVYGATLYRTSLFKEGKSKSHNFKYSDANLKTSKV
jgi:hypothetical protein